jgi:uncharacterized membrane protein (UPF0136 family)
MNHSNILKRSWQILWSYRALWVFGFLLAFTTTSGNPGSSSNARVYDDNSQPAVPGQFGEWGGQFQDEFERLGEMMKRLVEGGMTPDLQNNLIIAGVILIVFFLALAVVFTIIRFTSETALIKMVNEYEETGEKRGVRQGFRLGWSRAAWRLFLIDLILFIPLMTFIGGLIAAAVVLVMTGISSGRTSGIVAVVAGIGLVFLLIFVAMLVVIVLSVILRYIYRCCVLDDLGVIDSIRQGYGLARRHLKDTGIMALIMLGINIAFPILMLPVAFLLLAVSVLFGGGSALAVGGLTGLFSGDPSLTSVVSTIVVGGIIFIIFMSIPLNFLRGLKLTYQSSAWTLAFRELRALETLEMQPATEDAQALSN